MAKSYQECDHLLSVQAHRSALPNANRCYKIALTKITSDLFLAMAKRHFSILSSLIYPLSLTLIVWWTTQLLYIVWCLIDPFSSILLAVTSADRFHEFVVFVKGQLLTGFPYQAFWHQETGDLKRLSLPCWVQFGFGRGRSVLLWFPRNSIPGSSLAPTS